MIDPDDLIDDREQRDRLVERTDALAKVKTLRLLPDDTHVTVEMVASYYEVGVAAVKSLVNDNRAEIVADGYRVITGEELSFFKNMSGIDGLVGLRAPSLALFPRRAVLRVGLLLRDSPVAKQVRTALLDVEREQREAAPTLVDFSSTDAAITTLTAMLDFLRQKQTMELAAEGQRAELEAARPKAAFVDSFVDPTQDATLVRVVAQQLGYGEYRLRNWLAERKIIYRRPAGQRYSDSQRKWVDEYEWTPYSGYREWFVVRDQPEAPRLHNGQLRTTMYVSALGKQKIRELIDRTGGPDPA